MAELWELIQAVGFPLGLVLFFVWHSTKREEKLVQRLDALDTWVREEMLDVIKENTKVLSHFMESSRPQENKRSKC